MSSWLYLTDKWWDTVVPELLVAEAASAAGAKLLCLGQLLHFTWDCKISLPRTSRFLLGLWVAVEGLNFPLASSRRDSSHNIVIPFAADMHKD